MSQATLDDDELFGEAASEMEDDVREHLDAAWAALPEPDAVWDLEAENTLGAINALRSAATAEEAREHLRSAKKWYTMGVRAEAFQDAEDLEADIESLEAVFERLTETRDLAGELAATLPELRNALDTDQE